MGAKGEAEAEAERLKFLMAIMVMLTVEEVNKYMAWSGRQSAAEQKTREWREDGGLEQQDGCISAVG